MSTGFRIHRNQRSKHRALPVVNARIRARLMLTSCSDVSVPASKAAFKSTTVAESSEMARGDCARVEKLATRATAMPMEAASFVMVVACLNA